MTLAISYVRWSSDEQANGDTKRRQSDMARDYCTRHGLELDETRSCEDAGVSAYRGKNVGATGGLGLFLEAVRAGEIPQGTVLLIEALDRLSRAAPRKALRVIEDLIESGIRVVTLDNGKEWTLEALDGWEFMEWCVKQALAHQESVQKARRVSAAWSSKRSRASETPLTSRGPAWLQLIDGRWQVLDDRAEIVREIYRLALEGHGKQGIACILNERGVPPFKNGHHWQRSSVLKILNNPAVGGICVPHRVVHDENGKLTRVAEDPIANYYPPILDPETITRVRLLQERHEKRSIRASQEIKNVLGVLAVCGRCGGGMERTSKGTGRSGAVYLTCRRALAKAGCPRKSVRYDKLLEVLQRVAPDLVAPGGKDDALDLEVENAAHAVDVLQENVAQLLQGISYQATQSLVQELAETEQELEAAQRTLEKARRAQRDMTGPMVERRLKELQRALRADRVDPAEANRLLRLVFSKAVVDQDRLMLELHWRHGGITEVPYDWPE